MLGEGELRRYLESLEMDQELRRLVDRLKGECNIFPGKLPDNLLITEELDSDTRTFKDLFFFYEKELCVRLEDFTKPNPKYHLVILDTAPQTVTVRPVHFDLYPNAANDESQLTIRAEWPDKNLTLELAATKENCGQLMRVAREYILRSYCTGKWTPKTGPRERPDK